jgi:hypothetical protein
MNITFLRVSILVSFLFLIKPLEFVATNILEVNFLSHLLTPIYFSLTFLLITLFLTCLLNLFFNEKRILILLTFCGFFFYFQFYWLQIVNFFEYILSVQALFFYKTISLLIILSASVFLAYSCLKNKFFRYPLVISFLVVCSQLILISTDLQTYLNKDSENFSLVTSALQEEQKKTSMSNNGESITSKNNVYYIVLDGLASLNFIKKHEELNSEPYEDFVKKVTDNGYFHISQSNSSYNITYLTFASIFNLDYFDKDLTYKNRFSFFPHFLYKQGDPPKLVKELDGINYNFFYSGNDQWANCNKRKIIHAKCLNKPSENKFYSMLMNDGFITFIRNSLFIPLESKLESIFNIKSFQPFDGIENFLGSNNSVLNPNSSSFYLIHNESPHPPYLDSSCVINSLAHWSKDKMDWVSLIAYYQSVKCVLIELTKLLDIINEQDPDAIVVIQGDHGSSSNYDWKGNPLLMEKSAVQDRFSIFNALKVPRHCDQPKSLKLGNVETIQLVMACLKNEKAKEPKNLSYAGGYAIREGIFGQLIDVTDRLD